MYQQQYGQSLPAHYSANLSHPSYPTPATTLSQESAYGYPATVLNGSHTWAPSTRSMSSEEGEDVATGFSAPYRTSTYPSFERRMANELARMPTTTSSMLVADMQAHQGVPQARFHEPAAYQPLEAQHSWTSDNSGVLHPTPTSIASSYSHAWYQPQPSVLDQRGSDDGTRILSSQPHFPQSEHHTS
jgi:hypothetical protein